MSSYLDPLREAVTDAARDLIRERFGSTVAKKLRSSLESLLVNRSITFLIPTFLQHYHAGRFVAMQGYPAYIVDQGVDRVNQLAESVMTNTANMAAEAISRANEIDIGSICDISATGGDAHCGGRTTLVLNTDRGKFVYRPIPPLAARMLYVVYQECLMHLLDYDDWCEYPEFPLTTHSFTRFLDAENSFSPDTVRTFYRSIGALIATAFIVRATDLHFENIIAHRGIATPIDIEAIGHKHYDGTTFTVLDTGLVGQDHLSGVSGGGIVQEFGMFPRAEFIDFLKPKWSAQNRLVDNCGTLVDPLAYESEIIDGFIEAGRAITQKSRKLLDSLHKVSLDSNSGSRTRVILRPTIFYGALIAHLCQPFRDEYGVREVISHRLRTNRTTRWASCPIDVVDSEISDLSVGDIPYFASDIFTGEMTGHLGQTLQVKHQHPSAWSVIIESLQSANEITFSNQISILRRGLRDQP